MATRHIMPFDQLIRSPSVLGRLVLKHHDTDY
jgi:hypothetical protein